MVNFNILAEETVDFSQRFYGTGEMISVTDPLDSKPIKMECERETIDWRPEVRRLGSLDNPVYSFIYQDTDEKFRIFLYEEDFNQLGQPQLAYHCAYVINKEQAGRIQYSIPLSGVMEGTGRIPNGESGGAAKTFLYGLSSPEVIQHGNVEKNTEEQRISVNLERRATITPNGWDVEYQEQLYDLDISKLEFSNTGAPVLYRGHDRGTKYFAFPLNETEAYTYLFSGSYGEAASGGIIQNRLLMGNWIFLTTTGKILSQSILIQSMKHCMSISPEKETMPLKLTKPF